MCSISSPKHFFLDVFGRMGKHGVYGGLTSRISVQTLAAGSGKPDRCPHPWISGEETVARYH